MANLILKYRLKDGVSPADFEEWVRTTDYPKMRSLERVQSFTTYRCETLLMGEGTPDADYIEIFTISDLNAFTGEDMPGELVQSVMGQFMGFADEPQFIIASEVK
mgnify:CR=1 FL=1